MKKLFFLISFLLSFNSYSAERRFFTDDPEEMIRIIERQKAPRSVKDDVISKIIEKGIGQLSFMTSYPPIGRMTCTAGNYKQDTSCIYVPTLYGGTYALKDCTLACVGTTVTYFCEDAIPCI